MRWLVRGLEHPAISLQSSSGGKSDWNSIVTAWISDFIPWNCRCAVVLPHIPQHEYSCANREPSVDDSAGATSITATTASNHKHAVSTTFDHLTHLLRPVGRGTQQHTEDAIIAWL